MTAPATEPVLPDAWKTLLWRQEELERAGFPTLVAMALAERTDIDWHDACNLLAAGATPEQAARILL